jgi:hypothetical protein
LDNPVVDHAAVALKTAMAKFAGVDRMFANPASPRPLPPLAGSFVNPRNRPPVGVFTTT